VFYAYVSRAYNVGHKVEGPARDCMGRCFVCMLQLLAQYCLSKLTHLSFSKM